MRTASESRIPQPARPACLCYSIGGEVNFRPRRVDVQNALSRRGNRNQNTNVNPEFEGVGRINPKEKASFSVRLGSFKAP